MNNQIARSLFMDYLYDEITSEDKKRLESYLQENPSMQDELDKLRQTRVLLQSMPAEDPSRKLLVMEPRERSFGQWWQDAKGLFPQTAWGKTAFAIAASFLMVFLLGSVARVHVSSTDAGYSISLGYQPVINEGLSDEQAEALITQIRQENAAMLGDYAQAMNRQNQQQLKQVVQYFEQQRMNDLQLIDQNLDQFHQVSNYRWQQTNQFLGQMLQNVSLNEND